MPKASLFLVDGTAFCYRAFYALKGLSTSFGQPTNAIYGFINILNKILKKQKPDYLGVCFDVSRDTFRSRKFAGYKSQRPEMPDELSSQMPLLKQVISAYGIAIFEKEGFEADDIIATIAACAKKEGLFTTIISSDKDILQLVDEDTVVFSPHKDAGLLYDREKVLGRFGVLPERVADIIALMGDEADNIPGVAGIGEKTAAALIRRFGSVEDLLHNIDEIKPEKIKAAVRDNVERIRLNRDLALLDRGMELDCALDKLKIGEPDLKEIFKLFKYLEFKKLLKDLPQQENEPQGCALAAIPDGELRGLIKEDRLFIHGESAESLVFCAGAKFFRAEARGRNLEAVLADPRIKKTGYDLKKIKVSLAKDGLILEGLYFDAMIAAYLLDPSRGGYSLSDAARDYLDMLLKSEAIDGRKALELIMRLEPRLEKELEEKSLYRLFADVEMPLAGVLAEMEEAGIKLDLEVIKGLSQGIENRLIELIGEIYAASGAQFNINSPKQLRDILFVRLKLPVLKKTKTGPSTDEEVLRRLADKHRLPALLLEYRQLAKLKNTYIDTLPALVSPVTGRLHTSFNQAATETGRLSSSSPNLQNIPVKTDIGRNIRRAITASDKEGLLLSCDYSQIELRILAHLSKDENLTLAFRQNKDIHRATASLIYGLEEKDISEEMRETAKRVNFGITYGLSAYGLSRDLGISLEDAQRFIDAYFLRYPKVKEYIQKQINQAESEGYVTTILGRRRYIPQINDRNQAIRQFAQRQAVNTPIQGSASDLIKLAMLKIHQEVKNKGLKAKMVLQVHDELVFDSPCAELETLLPLVRRGMEDALALDVPVKVDIKKGDNWLEMEEIG